jgi:gamma-glutamyltranspeptidase/glutathione hydrolase
MSIDLRPSVWPDGEYQRWWAIQSDANSPRPQAEGSHGAVATAYNGFANRIGLEALKQGGSSVDAALATALAQVTLDAGAAISFAGIMTMIHYDAKSGEAVVMNAGWNTVKGEDDPATIPGMDLTTPDGMFSGTPSGRTAFVPGFMKGVEAAHRRFGKLPFEALFAPSIELAEEGFEVYPEMEIDLSRREADLARVADTRAVFFKPDGTRYREGDRFLQPALARTLGAIAKGGANHMYKGPWAEKLVAALKADGGKMTLEDLADYDVIWSEPVSGTYAGCEVLTMGGPGLGGLNLIEALNLAEAAGVAGLPHWSEDPEAFRRMALITMPALPLTYLPVEVTAPMLPGVDLSRAARMTKENARKLWDCLQAGSPLATPQRRLNHSDVVVATDADGNMTAVCHSINCVFWGKTAIMVDGVSIGDPAAHQQGLIAMAGPGARLPDPTCVGLVKRDGTPFLAFSSMASGLHHKTVQALVNTLAFGMEPKAASDAPSLLFPAMAGGVAGMGEMRMRVRRGEFSPELLERTGLEIEQVDIAQLRLAQGIWVGLARAPDGTIKANAPAYTSGYAVGY